MLGRLCLLYFAPFPAFIYSCGFLLFAISNRNNAYLGLQILARLSWCSMGGFAAERGKPLPATKPEHLLNCFRGALPGCVVLTRKKRYFLVQLTLKERLTAAYPGLHEESA